MSLFDKYMKQAKLSKIAEEAKEDEKELPTEDLEKEAEDENDEEGFEVEASDDEDEDDAPEEVKEVGDAVEAAVEAVANDLRKSLLRSKLRAQVNDAIFKALNYHGILVANPYKGKNLKQTKLTRAEVGFIRNHVSAAVEAVEEILARSAMAIKKAGFGKKEASALDKRYAKNGYLRSTVAAPQPVGKRTAAPATKKRATKNVLGL